MTGHYFPHFLYIYTVERSKSTKCIKISFFMSFVSSKIVNVVYIWPIKDFYILKPAWFSLIYFSSYSSKYFAGYVYKLDWSPVSFCQLLTSRFFHPNITEYIYIYIDSLLTTMETITL